MQLKKLILKGFKSFAEKTTLDFNDGVTAVVGPNGSGKSNIIEAIQWVMGEQSAKSLRGGKMNDVIFSGTHSRKPMNIAEVTLVLDNSSHFLPVDFEEINITRRLSRSGDSDYFINKQPCRLKDIVDLFMDSGLGKESFSIISQGQVEAIFNSKAEDRRAIFEEAAGVFKYKLHKQKAEKKLDETQDNLDRVQDILYELEGQIEPLKEQADIAESYLRQKEELTDLDIGITVLDIKELSQKMDHNKQQLKDFNELLSEVDVKITENQQDLAQTKGKSQEIKEKRDQIQTQIVESVQKIERAESSLALHDEKLKHKEAFIQEKQGSVEKQEAQIEQLKGQISEIKEKAQAQKTLIDDLSKQIKEKRERLSYFEEGREERMEEIRSHYMDLLQKRASLNNEEQTLNRDISKENIQEEKSVQQKDQLEKDINEAQKEFDEKTEKLETVKQELDDLLERFQEKDREYKEFNQALGSKEQRVQDLKNQLEQAKVKQNSLSEMQENYAGYFAGVKVVMKNTDRLNGIVGTVADLVQIPKDYLEAIDTVLGSSSQFVVVEDEKAGRQAIRYLKENRSGRATFLPLTTIKPRYIQEQFLDSAKQVGGFIGLASDLISFDEKISAIVRNLLGNTIVATSLDTANKIAKAVSYRYRVVSLDGNVMNAGGSMTGGGGKRSSNSHIFTQKEDLKKLNIFIQETTKTIDHRLEELTKEREKQKQSSEKLEEIQKLGEEKRYSENQLENELKSSEDSLNRLTRQLKSLDFEFTTLSEDLKANKNRLAEVQNEKETVHAQIEAYSQEMADLTDEKESSETKKAEINEEIESLQADLNEKRETYASLKATLNNLNSQLEQNEQTLDQLQTDIQAYRAGEVTESKEELSQKLHELNALYAKQKEQETNLKQKQVEYEDQVEELEKVISDLKEKQAYYTSEKNELEVKNSRSDVSTDHKLEYLVDEYGMSFEEARLLPELDVDYEEAAKQVKLLKKGIEELGPVNVNSIDEYKKVSDRYKFLSKQQDDLIEAKSQLFNTMDEMDNEVKRRFKEKFDQIKNQFSIVFPQMFGGGRAELRLTDPDDLLTSGVEIVAQPPGKKLASLSLLSGGERALTAISLLFAIIQVSKVPFCILDEAETALDETNVARFGKYLREFETDTQFIVITHRKGTMEEADSLYGITMQEKGISKLVSVRLEDVEEMDLTEEG